ncbi:MAG: ErfK/YbiS/YcfS/YnhG family protein [Gemmatimonadetes bacterium]|nr:ErfK/YbiS/YcfS/YnhG family protein [Gemmatimonadota bacterium]
MTKNKSSLRLAAIGTMMAATAFAACKKSGHANGEVSRNWQPPKAEVYMGVPAAEVQAAVQTRLAAAPPAPITADQWKHVKKLYGSFNNGLLWLDDKGVHQPRVGALLNAVAGADSDAIKLEAFPLAELGRTLAAVDDKKATAQQLAEADVLLSSAFTALGETMLTGQEQPSQLAQAWHINPLEEKVDSALSLTLREDDFAAGLVRMRPQDAAYDSLRNQFAAFRNLVTKGGWTSVPEGRALKRGDSDSPARMEALRARLRTEGYLPEGGATLAAAPMPDSATKAAKTRAARTARTGPGVYDRELAGAVASFQARHSIGVDSMLGKETVDAMNVPASYRLAQIASNLERFRWMPRALGNRYIMVNVPEFRLTAYDSGQTSLEMKVIVGQEYEDKATPVFSDSMEYVVFRPYWNVTPTIAAKEIFPKEAANPGYLEANDMEVYDDHGRKAVRQRPGPKNSLGFVKFLFPNDYNIYLHDTPNHELFKKDVRAFSHGCIRVEKPAELAEWVLGWPLDKVHSAMDGADNHQVTLPKKLPVYIVYFTTFVNDGQLNFGNDLYDRDSKLVKELQGVAMPSPETLKAQQTLRALANGQHSADG